jgi:hypothetical protein
MEVNLSKHGKQTYKNSLFTKRNLFRYERDLQSTRTGTIRQGALFGAFSGWLYLINYIVHAVGFIFGSILISYENPGAPSLTDIIIVGALYYRIIM